LTGLPAVGLAGLAEVRRCPAGTGQNRLSAALRAEYVLKFGGIQPSVVAGQAVSVAIGLIRDRCAGAPANSGTGLSAQGFRNVAAP